MSDEDKNIDETLEKDVDTTGGDKPEKEESSSDDTPFFSFDDEKEEKEEKKEEKKEVPEEIEKKESEAEPKDYVSREEHEAFKREQQVSEFLNNPKNEDYKEFGDKIKELAKHPAAKGLTVNALARMAVPEEHWIKKGAELASNADAESRKTFTSGSAARDEVKGKSGDELGDPYAIKDGEEFLVTALNLARKD